MKKALTVSLAQTLFTIEDDAYAILDHYLQSVKAHFSNTSGQEEIIQDIESRIAEQFLESGKNIITLAEVNSVMASMGAADQFGDTNDNAPKVENVINAKKKLYRNPDDAIIAGVCSGLAAYFDTSVVGVRIIFFILAMMNGFGVLLYILLWIITPAAKTASQKLEMTGSPVTLATLSESVRERVEEAAQKASPTFKKVLAAPFVVIGIILRALVNKVFPALRMLFGLFLTCASFCGMIALSFGAGMIMTSSHIKYVDFPIHEVVSTPLFYGVVIGGYLVLLIPIFFMFMSGISLIRKKNSIRLSLGFGLLGVWCIALVTAGVSGVNAGVKIHEYRLNSPQYQMVERMVAIKEPITALEVINGPKVTLIQGSEAGTVFKAREKDIEYIDLKIENGILEIAAIEHSKTCIFCDYDYGEVIVTVPNLDSISIIDGGRVVAASWKSAKAMNVIMDNGGRAEMNVEVPEFIASLNNGARLDVTGKAVSSTFKAESGARVDAQEFVVENIIVNAKFGARLAVHATKTLSVTADQGARVDYVGKPVLTKKIKQGARVEPIWPEEPNEIEEPKPIESIEPVE